MKTLILANGQAPGQKLFEDYIAWADLFIAADGGGNTAHTLGHLPDVLIGDIDSYQPHEHEPYEIIHDPDQDSNDLEKALKLALKKSASHIKILGATGLRLDHTLKNLSVLKQFNNQFKEISLQDNEGETFLLPPQFSQELATGTTVSLFPLSGKVTGITTKGLKYPLHEDFLENGIRDGSSNYVISSPFSISHKKGDLLLFIAK